MKKNVTMPADEKIAELNELQGKIVEISAMLFKTAGVIRSKTAEREKLKQDVETFIQDYRDHHPGYDFTGNKTNIRGDFNIMNLNATEREQYFEITSKISTVEKELLDAKARHNKLRDQEAALLSNMAAMNANYATECLLYLQKKHNDIAQTVDTINDAITAQQNIIDQEKASSQPAINAAMKKREEILADIALGTVDAKELAAIDEQLRSATDTASESTEKMDETVIVARQTITGLRRKLEVAQEELEALKLAKIGAEERFLLAEAEKAGQEYVVTAKALSESFKRLLALNAIMDNKKFETIELGNFRQASIPLFNLNCHKEHGESEFEAIINAYQFTDIETDMQSEFDRFSAIGIHM